MAAFAPSTFCATSLWSRTYIISPPRFRYSSGSVRDAISHNLINSHLIVTSVWKICNRTTWRWCCRCLIPVESNATSKRQRTKVACELNYTSISWEHFWRTSFHDPIAILNQVESLRFLHFSHFNFRRTRIQIGTNTSSYRSCPSIGRFENANVMGNLRI